MQEKKIHICTLVFFGQTKYNVYHYVGGAIWITLPDRRILQYCNDKRIDGAVKMGNTWLIPKDANKPADGRYKMNKEKQLGTKGDLLDE